MKLFADTSALLKRYVQEDGTDAVNEILGEATRLAVSSLAVVEATSALVRRRAAGDLTGSDYASIQWSLLEDLRDAEWIPVTESLLATAVRLVETHELRTLDSLQLAAALAAAPDVFLCADQRLVAAGAAAGLSVHDPTRT